MRGIGAGVTRFHGEGKAGNGWNNRWFRA